MQAGPRFLVSGHAPTAVLIDEQGKVLHEWGCFASEVFSGEDLKGSGASYFRRARLLPDGGIAAIFHNVGLVRLDRDSNVLWSYKGNRVHHDLTFDPDGNIWLLDREVGVVDWIHTENPVLADFIVKLSPEGKLLSKIPLLECIANSPYREEIEEQVRADLVANLAREVVVIEKNKELFEEHPEKLALLNLTGDVFHSNTLQWLDGKHAEGQPHFGRGQLMIGIRNLGRVVTLDPESKSLTWSMPGILRPGFHDPRLTEEGTVVLFDNVGPEQREEANGFSEIVEVDPKTGEVLWSYRARRRHEFYSPIAGTCMRLPNGHTLVTQSTAGRAFEVNLQGKVVWDYLSPYRAGENDELVAFLPDVVIVAADWLDR